MVKCDPMRLKNLLLMLLTWWHRRTLGTALYTWRNGVRVGADEAGNQYYENRDKSRRWVIYCDEVEASRVPPRWHEWLHHMSDTPPPNNALLHPWMKPHAPNATGSAAAHRPHARANYAPRAYHAWRADGAGD